MILFHLVVGRPPWYNLSGLDAVKQAAQGDRPIPPRDLDGRLQALLKECWSENPHARPPFSTITKILTAYSRDVFHANEDNLVAVGPLDIDRRCDCAIL